jgi:hypothetical protein
MWPVRPPRTSPVVARTSPEMSKSAVTAPVPTAMVSEAPAMPAPAVRSDIRPELVAAPTPVMSEVYAAARARARPAAQHEHKRTKLAIPCAAPAKICTLPPLAPSKVLCELVAAGGQDDAAVGGLRRGRSPRQRSRARPRRRPSEPDQRRRARRRRARPSPRLARASPVLAVSARRAGARG